MKMPRPALIYQGGKYRLVEWIISFFPPHVKYLEPFGGAANVLLNKRRSDTEVYNEIDNRVYMVFKVMQDREKAKELEYRLRYTPYSREEWKLAYADQEPDNEVEIARLTIIRAFMSNGANGATRKGKSGFGMKFKDDSKVSQVAAWQNYADCLPLFFKRLQGVILENKDAIKLIKFIDGPSTLHYIDPPYMPETWAAASDKYKYSIDADYHKNLIDTMKECKGMIVLSGYDNALYKSELADWQMFTKQTINQRNEHRIECVWINPECQKRLSNKQCSLL